MRDIGPDRVFGIPEHFDVIVRLLRMVRKLSQEQDINGRRPAVGKYEIGGIKISVEKGWFLTSRLRKFTIKGKDWRVIISFAAVPGYVDAHCEVDGAFWYLLELDIHHQERLERDLVLLRMFGVEELFSG